ncbi:Protein of unknown function [Pyronema omphalodes CBS 100304]|uniref:Uncharacterized protein n=1 Tax=Pyronema omphalodes (strain CBS 100304) TaxID=1076935 RepID=U4LSY0_PYROM|nr:Protein of unknown function [Pyronema omphalodes CBS 100304]
MLAGRDQNHLVPAIVEIEYAIYVDYHENKDSENSPSQQDPLPDAWTVGITSTTSILAADIPSASAAWVCRL